MIRKISTACVAGLLALLVSNVASAKLEDEIRERLAPVAPVCVVGDDCAAGIAIAGADTGPKAPEDVYQTYCFACHATGANESPIMGDAEAWAPRVAKGIDALYESAINGFNDNLMPARGLCMDCSDDDIKATVDYLVEAVQ